MVVNKISGVEIGTKWGNISGTLLNQTDLSTAMSGKLNTKYDSSEGGKVLYINTDGDVEPTRMDVIKPNVVEKVLVYPSDSFAYVVDNTLVV